MLLDNYVEIVVKSPNTLYKLKKYRCYINKYFEKLIKTPL